MEIFRIIGIGILTCIVSVIVKQLKPEFNIIIVLAGSIIILFMLIDELETIFNYFSSIITKTSIPYSTFSCLLKIIGVGFLTEFANGICIDTGNTSIGDKIVLGGKATILCLALPIISSLLNIIVEILP